MRLGVALLVGCAGLLAGCGAHGTGTRAGGTAVSAAAVSAAVNCAPTDAVLSRWREMTWAEYYADVQDKAWRRGAVVIWVETPRVRKAARAERPAGCR